MGRQLNELTDEYNLLVQRTPIVDGQLIEDIDLTSGETFLVKHGLGRTVLGWIVVDSTAQFDDLHRDVANTRQESELALVYTGGASQTISLWVF